MSVYVECDRVDCGETCEIGLTAGMWVAASPEERAQARATWGEHIGDLLHVHLPDGWRVEFVSHDRVIHCAEHADAKT